MLGVIHVLIWVNHVNRRGPGALHMTLIGLDNGLWAIRNRLITGVEA